MPTSESGQRLIVDASTLIRWRGPPVGIVRVEAEIIRAVLDQEADVILSVFDTRIGEFREFDRAVARRLIDGKACVETGLLPDPRPKRSALRRALAPVERGVGPVLRFGRTLACWLDALRRRLQPGTLRAQVTSAVGALAGRRLRSQLVGPEGERRDLFSLGTALGPVIQLGPRDTMLSAGFDWSYKDLNALADIEARTGFRLVAMCYDLIPIKFPQYYQSRDVQVFTRYLRAAIGFTDRFIAISKRSAADLAEFAQAEGMPLPDMPLGPMGADPVRRQGGTGTLPPRIEPGNFVLFVSTVEPRKNHALLLRVWKRLLNGEQGGTGGCKLVFAGRRGWMVDHVFTAIAADPALASSIFQFAPTDEQLEALYRNARFCAYPSFYEGFGLPVIEAYAYGKPVVCSSAGSLPEAAGNLAGCLDPNDDDAWVEAVGRRINDPALLAAESRRIVAEFSWPTWPEAAARIIAVARA